MPSPNSRPLQFGEEFRPCQLKRFVYGYPRKQSNEFQFQKSLDYKLYGHLQQHSVNKPILVFCPTRKGKRPCGPQGVVGLTRVRHCPDGGTAYEGLQGGQEIPDAPSMAYSAEVNS